jgi:hypothetical protein
MKTEAGQVIADRLNKPMEFMIVRPRLLIL